MPKSFAKKCCRCGDILMIHKVIWKNVLIPLGRKIACAYKHAKKAVVVCPGPGCTFGPGGVKHGPDCPKGAGA